MSKLKQVTIFTIPNFMLYTCATPICGLSSYNHAEEAPRNVLQNCSCTIIEVEDISCVGYYLEIDIVGQLAALHQEYNNMMQDFFVRLLYMYRYTVIHHLCSYTSHEF
jgi:hypothetical protein